MIVTMLILLIPGFAFAQENGVKFLENVSFAQAMEQAKNANKMLFVDCYTSWCGPCKMMLRDVFPQKSVADYFNPKFVCAKFDMEKGEGVELKNKYSVKAYPTFLIFDSQTGEEITRIVGGNKADAFIKTIEESLKDGGLASLRKKYEAGNRDNEFVLSYIEALERGYYTNEVAAVTEDFLKGKESELLQNKDLYKLFEQHISSPYNSIFQYVWNHKDEFIQKYGNGVKSKLENTYIGYPMRTFVVKNGKERSFDQAGMDKYIKFLEEVKFDRIDYIKLNSQIMAAQLNKDWKTMLELAHQYDKTYKATDQDIYNWCMNLERGCTDNAVRQDAAKWIKERLASIEKEIEEQSKAKAQGGTTPAMSMVSGPIYKNAYEGLLKQFEATK